MTTLSMSLDHYLDLALRHRPYGFTGVNDPMFEQLQVAAKNGAPIVVENEAWTEGFDTLPMPACSPGIYRIWRRRDWELCDNKRKDAVVRIEMAQAQYRKVKEDKLSAVKADLATKGVTELVINMLVASMDDTTLDTMFNNITVTNLK